MDTIKIGQFIKSLRKENSLTQREVAERLNVSEKTVSKWETGNGMPEVSIMLPLFKLFGISINELLINCPILMVSITPPLRTL